MRFFPEYDQPDPRALDELIQSLDTATLVTRGPAGLHAGIFNAVRVDGRFLLHLHKEDEQVQDLRTNPAALLVFQDVLAQIPSYWVDEAYGGAATQYYRYAELRVEARILDTPAAIHAPLQAFMDRYQPEGGHAPLGPHAKVYRGSYAVLVVAELTVAGVRTKWKLGQNRPLEVRRRVADRLGDRGRPQDARTALLVRESLKAAAGGDE